MAVEAKRGCGFRKVGGLYLVSGRATMACCKLPVPLTVCPCCGQGIKQTRGWTWVNPAKLLGDKKCLASDLSQIACPAAYPARMGERAGLLWVGRQFYPTPESFDREAAAMGVSRRITTIPHGFEVGKTWILFAHPDTIKEPRTIEAMTDGKYVVKARGVIERDKNDEPEAFETMELATHRAGVLDQSDPLFTAGIFRIFLPERVERIVLQSEFDMAAAACDVRKAKAAEGTEGWVPEDELMAATLKKFDIDNRRGITWVPVPDGDKDHQGSVYAKEEAEAE